MAANTGQGSSGSKQNFYSIVYGMLRANAKEAPEGFEKISLSHIKSEREKKKRIDLRQKYYDTENGKEYPLRVFYTDIDGTIKKVEKETFPKGVSLRVTLLDAEGDESVLTTIFYGKVGCDFLNRMLGTEIGKQYNFRPYSVLSDAEIEGEKITFWNAGVSIKDNGEKIDRAFKYDTGLPATERVKNAQGIEETSRVKQADFLWEKVQAKFAQLNEEYDNSSNQSSDQPTQEAPAQNAEQAEPATANASGGEQKTASGVNKKDLPF